MASPASRRDFLKSASAAALYVALAGACGAGSSSNASLTPKKGGHLIDGFSIDLQGFINLLNSDAASTRVATLLFDPLVVIGLNSVMTPVLAEAPGKFSSDGLSATFKIRSDARWTDGQPVTADDVAFTYSVLIDDKYKETTVTAGAAALRQYLASVTAVDSKTVVFKASKVNANFAFVGTQIVYPKHVLGSLSAKELNTTDFKSNPTVSSGVFKFVEWKKGDRVTLTRNENYYRGAAYLDGYVFRPVGVGSFAQALQTGELDVAYPPTDSLDRLKQESHLIFSPVDPGGMVYFHFNLTPGTHASTLWADRKVRQALLYAVDREQAVKTVYGTAYGSRVPLSHVVYTNWAYNPNVQPKYKRDKAKAEQMLDQAGWIKNSSGVREKNGVALRWEVLVPAAAQPKWLPYMEVLQQQWKEIGVDVSLKNIDGVPLISQYLQERTYDMMTLDFAPGATDPDLSSYFGSAATAKGGANGTGYKNPELDQLFAEGLAILDRSKRKPIYDKIQDILATDIPSVPMVAGPTNYVYNKRVQGMNLNTLAYSSARPWMKDVWVTDGK